LGCKCDSGLLFNGVFAVHNAMFPLVLLLLLMQKADIQ